MRKSGHGCYHRVFYLRTARHARRSSVFPAKLVPGTDRGAGIHPAAHPSFPRSLSPTQIGERESTPPLTRLSREACPRPRSGSRNPSRRLPVFPAKAGIHAFLMLDCHWTRPKCMGTQELSRKLNDPGRYHARVPAPKCRRCRGRFSTEGCCKGYPLQHRPKVQPEAATRVALCTVAAAWHWS